MVSGLLFSSLVGRKAQFVPKSAGKIPPDYIGEDAEIVVVWTNPAGMVQVGLAFDDGHVFEPYLNQIKLMPKEGEPAPTVKARKAGS